MLPIMYNTIKLNLVCESELIQKVFYLLWQNLRWQKNIHFQNFFFPFGGEDCFFPFGNNRFLPATIISRKKLKDKKIPEKAQMEKTFFINFKSFSHL
jgi:hypothetical protein